jgi:hypothetical protein
MKKIAIFSLAMLGMAMGPTVVPATATTSGFDFTECGTSSNYYGVAQTENSSCGSASYSNTSGSFSQTIGAGANAITVTATAYVTTTDSNAVNTPLESGKYATIGQYTGNGIGVCSATDPGYSVSNPNGCSVPSHQVDDSGDYEFVLLTFSTPVNINSITLANFGATSGTETQFLDQMGFTYWGNPTSEASIIAGGTSLQCGVSGDTACPTSEGNGSGIGTTASSGSWTSGFGTNGQSTLSAVTSLLIASNLSETDDFFKIQGLFVSKGSGQGGATPEPSTFGMLGLALAGFGLYGRRRKVKSEFLTSRPLPRSR